MGADLGTGCIARVKYANIDLCTIAGDFSLESIMLSRTIFQNLDCEF